ncbi:ORFIII-like polyprotein [Tanacetum coccineum]|uniref:ORFIII-like polyprotein n=1 Tax=Tanacetum coccineum TaxID=301880 RepID=A0ABQ4WZ41_9ASTR
MGIQRGFGDFFSCRDHLKAGKTQPYTRAVISVAYEWQPLRCTKCKKFGHSFDKCPKIVRDPVTSTTTDTTSDGFTEVTRKKNQQSRSRHIDGIRLIKPKLNFYWQKKGTNKSGADLAKGQMEAVTGTGVKINIEHIEGKHNTLADSLSRLVNLCFAECTGEMNELVAATLYSVEEVLQSPNAFQKNMKITCEEVMKISNHFLESSLKLSSHLKNQEHYTNVTSSRPIKLQSEWINLMHGDHSPKTLQDGIGIILLVGTV